jgi:hypothetical protein
MDPFYFLKLDILFPSSTLEKDKFELYDIDYDMYPNGDWSLGNINNEEYKIIYNNDKYDMITFNNDTKQLVLYKGNKQIKSFKMTFIEIEKQNK